MPQLANFHLFAADHAPKLERDVLCLTLILVVRHRHGSGCWDSFARINRQTIDFFDVSPFETTQCCGRHTNAERPPTGGLPCQPLRSSVLLRQPDRYALAAAVQSAPGERIGGKGWLPRACLPTADGHMDDLRVSGDTTTMQVVQHTLGCASAAKWIDAFR
jgi:hypothetical protein